MTDNVAILAGFTSEIEACNDIGQCLALLVEPGTDYDATFKAWDMDGQQFIRLNGWLWTVEAVADHRKVELAIQCVPPGGDAPATFLFRRNVGRPVREGELVSPTYSSLADLHPWAVANGWAAVPGSWEYRHIAA
ncbi:hypothetical protein [Caulobacter sp.]|uniref:hypothetical protein n=1 Tax=Caulobacter sp. TaxID=78 RepID=UPI0031CFAB84